MQRTDGYTRASALGPLAGFIDGCGGRVARVFERADIPLGVLAHPELPLPLREQFKILSETGLEIGEIYAGARLGQLVCVSGLGAFGGWVSDAKTLGGSIERCRVGLNRYLQTGTKLAVWMEGDFANWSIEFFDPGRDGRLQNELLGVSYLISGVRLYAGASWRPALVRTTGDRPGQASALEKIFCAPVSTGHSRCSIAFDPALLAFRRRRSPSASGAPEHSGEPPLPDPSEALEAAAAVTSLALLEGYPKIDWVAGKLGMSRRGLQRALSASGASFSQLLDELLRDRAVAALGAPGDRAITDIAFALGYSDAAHFTRAFRRWTGVSPRAFRERRKAARP